VKPLGLEILAARLAREQHLPNCTPPRHWAQRANEDQHSGLNAALQMALR
jgi:hypothetical protein